MLDISGTMHPSKGGRFIDMKVASIMLHLLLLLLIWVVSLVAAGTAVVMLTCKVLGDCNGTCCHQS